MSKEIRIGDVTIGRKPFVFIGGPCVIEGRDITLRIAEKLTNLMNDLKVPFIFKASYDKANRTSIDNYRGPGLEEGLSILREVRTTFHVPIITDVHTPAEAPAAAEVADILQVPALLSRQTDLLVACGRTGKPVNVKKGQFLSPYDMINAVRKISSTGNDAIVLTERGTSFGYNTLVNDFRAIPIMKGFGYPVIFDATHSVQKPGGLSDRSGGEVQFVFPLARAAVAVGADGIFMEVHEDPSKALCDGENSVRIDDLPAMIGIMKQIGEVS